MGIQSSAAGSESVWQKQAVWVGAQEEGNPRQREGSRVCMLQKYPDFVSSNVSSSTKITIIFVILQRIEEAINPKNGQVSTLKEKTERL